MAKTKRQLRAREMTQRAESQGRGSSSSIPRSASSRSTNGDESSAKAAFAPVSVQHSTFNTAASSVADASRASSEPDDVYPYVLIIRPPSSAHSEQKQPVKDIILVETAATGQIAETAYGPATSGSGDTTADDTDTRELPGKADPGKTCSVADAADIVTGDSGSQEMDYFVPQTPEVLKPEPMSADQDAEMADSDPVETVGGALASVLVDVLIGAPAGQSEHAEQMVQDRDASDLSEELARPVGGAREPGQVLEVSVERECAMPESVNQDVEIHGESSAGDTTDDSGAQNEPTAVVEPVEPIGDDREPASQPEDVAAHDDAEPDSADNDATATGPVPGLIELPHKPRGQDESGLDPTSKGDGISELAPADAATNGAQIQEKRMDLVEEERRPLDMLKETAKHEDAAPGSAPTDQNVEIREVEQAAAGSVSPSEVHVANGDMTDSSLSECLTEDIDIDELDEIEDAPSSGAEAPLSLESICRLMPDPLTVCGDSFDHFVIPASVLEPAHALVAPRTEKTHIQAIYEYEMDTFPVVQDPGPWRVFQQKKYDVWASMHDSCRSVKVQLVPQTTSCMAKNELKQPQCRACIGRMAGKGCRFAMVRYVTKLTITMTDGRVVFRYLPCPVFRSEISKVPEVRQPITPIELPSRTVVPGDNDTWVEFHMLCQTASAMKSLLRRELAIVRELSPHAMHSDLRGIIRFHDTTASSSASEADSAIHPLYACSPAPCILRKVPLGARQRCDHCAAPIFAVYFSCCMCMQEFCAKCFIAWEDTDVTQHSYKIERGVKSPIALDDAQLGQSKDMSYCKRFAAKEGERTMHYIERHTKRQFVRVSHYTEGELEMMLRKVNRIAQYCDHLDTTQPSSYSSISLCANELPLEEPELRTDRSWMDEVLDRVDMDTEVIASLGDADFGSRPEYYARECEQSRTHLTPGAGPSRSQSAFLESAWDLRMRSLLLPKYPLKRWQKAPIYVSADDLTLREFARLWEEDNVVVVTGLADKIDAAKWTPTALLKAIAIQPTIVHIMGTTRTTPIGDITLAEFLGNKPSAKIMADKSYRATLKVTRQSSTADDDEDPKMAKSRGTLEDMVRATRMLSPFPQYTAPDGKLNLMNRLPPQYKQPELPSEVHMVRLSTDPNTKRRGRDNLRYDIADTFDLLVYASELPSEVETAQPAASKRRGRQAKAKPAVVDETPEPPKRHGRSANDQPTKSAGPSPAVVWDIYPFHLQEQLCSFLSNSDDSPPDTDQIITPRTFMGDKQCAEFYEDYEDAQAIRVFQNAGDLVMVPSGFTYQRQTARDTISVRSKFLSPEHASYARNVSEDVTKRGNARRHEALPVMDILWWAWLGCSDRGEASASEFISKSRKHHIAKGVAAAVQKSPAKRARTGSKKQTS